MRPRLPTHSDPKVQKERDRKRDHSNAMRERNKPVFRKIIDTFLDTECTDCGVAYPLPAMQADHVKGKRYKIAWFRGGNGTLKLLQEELARCEPRCANCHSIRHAAGGTCFVDR